MSKQVSDHQSTNDAHFLAWISFPTSLLCIAVGIVGLFSNKPNLLWFFLAGAVLIWVSIVEPYLTYRRNGESKAMALLQALLLPITALIRAILHLLH